MIHKRSISPRLLNEETRLFPEKTTGEQERLGRVVDSSEQTRCQKGLLNRTGPLPTVRSTPYFVDLFSTPTVPRRFLSFVHAFANLASRRLGAIGITTIRPRQERRVGLVTYIWLSQHINGRYRGHVTDTSTTRWLLRNPCLAGLIRPKQLDH